jgi:hypothetical protein
VEVAGDQVVDVVRYVFIPEEWSRKERAQHTLPGIFSTVCIVLVIAIVAGAAIIGVVQWSRRRQFSTWTFVAVFATLFLSAALTALNSWPMIASQASTAQPLALQVGIALVAGLVFGLFSAVALSLVAGLVVSKMKMDGGRVRAPLPSVLLGISIALVWAGVGALARHAIPPANPVWGNMGSASAVVPLVGGALAPLSGYFTQTLVILALVYALAHWPRAGWLWILAGLALVGTSGIDTMPSWLILGGTTGVVLLVAYVLVFRQEPSLIVLTTATLSILVALRDGFQHPYPAALAGFLIGIILIGIAGWTWYRSNASTL